MEKKQIKLNLLSVNRLCRKQMDALQGGNNCSCSCYWEEWASVEENRSANYNNNLYSEHGCNQYGETDCCYYYWFTSD